MAATKKKVSLTISADLLRKIDREAGRRRSRSSVVEAWLRRAYIISYYDSLSDEERAEDEAIAKAAGRAAKRLRIDD